MGEPRTGEAMQCCMEGARQPAGKARMKRGAERQSRVSKSPCSALRASWLLARRVRACVRTFVRERACMPA
eukprot:6209734-Pleurochrysis_carterae.AAC.2